MHVAELERLAERMRKMAGLGDGQIVDAGELAERLVGEGCLAVLESLAVGARLRPENGRYIIEVRDGLADINYAVSHEIGHFGLIELAKYRGPDEERCAAFLGAALLAPRTIVRAVVAKHGNGLEAVRPLARAVRVSQTAANLRLGEVLRDERAVVTANSNHVLCRADSAFPWTDPHVLQVARGRSRWRHLAKTRLHGGIDEGRVALKAP